MATTLKIQRSTGTATPTTLEVGELAYSSNGAVLFIGDPANTTVLAIGGLRVPGTLTANQALVANATSYINEIKTAKLHLTDATANVTHINSVANSTVLGAAANTEVTTTWAVKTYVDTATSNLVSTLDHNSLVNYVANQHIDHSGVSVIAGAGMTGGGNILASRTLNVVAGDGISVAADSVSVAAGNSQLVSNSSGLWINQTQIDHDSFSGFSANEHIDHSGVSVIAGAGMTGGGNLLASRTLNVVAGDGISVAADSVAVNPADGISANSTGIWAVGGTGVTVNSTGIHIGQPVNTNDNVTFANTITNDLTVQGNLDVQGTLTTIDTTNISVNDAIIELGRNNGTDALDIGLYGVYNDGTERYVGLIWDTSADVFELFANTTAEPSTTVDTAGVGYVRAMLKSYLDTGALVSNTTQVAITANSTIAVGITANTLSLSTPLPGTSGGTGKSSMTQNAILVGNSTNGFAELALGSDGEVLQVSGSSLAYAGLDGGTF